ncbi:MAG: carboxylating nicotinate-nucleotide diphosphorylase, partial [Limnochordia bacterium]|nr:carboxylating nicotinate-nucleotide diphosphorylase [Limnochordia bacterium]MDD4518858.1 carboxylating nicotinate-nucleotide diphosphorylase [Limnochordia bacterium]
MYKIKPLVDSALREDIGRGDITTESIVAPDAWGTAILWAKDDGVFCGEVIPQTVFSTLTPTIQVKNLVVDGQSITQGDVISQIQGPAWAILMGERVVLNFIQHLSGISTQTARLKALIADYPCHLVETRKTLPGLRLLQKYAVRVGGGGNHRLGLDDAVMIKDNHVVAAGSITEAVRAVRGKVPFTAKIEVETKQPEQVTEALAAGA